MIKVCCALIENHGELLICQRGEAMRHPGQWEFAGGKLEAEESAFACIEREILEELGLVVKAKVELPSHHHHYDDLSIELIPIICSLEGGELHLLEHAAINWLAPEKILLEDLVVADVQVVHAYVEYLKGM